MKKDDFKTDVIFRKEKDDSILAVFPYMIADYKGNCTCYSHIGQHNGLCWDYLRSTRLAKEIDYMPLKSELESLGYNLKIVKRRNYNRYLTELNKVKK
jgi:hypothetical protein